MQADVDDPGARIAIDHTIFHLDADLKWLETARGPGGRRRGRGDRDHDEAARHGGVSKAFGRTEALRAASLAVAEGETVAVTGPLRQREVHAAALPGRHPASGGG